MSATWKDINNWCHDRAISPVVVKAEWPKTWAKKDPSELFGTLQSTTSSMQMSMVRASVSQRNHRFNDDGELVPVLDVGLDNKVVEQLYKTLRIVLGTAEAKKILDAAKGAK